MTVPPRWVRRLAGPVIVYVVLVLTLTTLPLLLVAAALLSPWLPGKWRALRLLGFALIALATEAAALFAAFLLWVASGFGLLLHRPNFQRAHYWVLRWSVAALVGSTKRLFALRLETDEVSWSPLDDGTPGSPNAMIVIGRHAGPGDSVLLMHTLMNRDHLRRPRVVLAAAMQIDPVVDVFLHRLPSRFINPNPGAGSDVTRDIADLAQNMGDEDALLIFPEGRNFTPSRRKRAIESLRSRGLVNAASRAEHLRNLLPPRPAGVMAAIDAAPHADIVIVAHTGLDHLTTFRSLWRGIPEHKTLRLRWWFVPANEVPQNREERTAWLNQGWIDMDEWISAQSVDREA